MFTGRIEVVEPFGNETFTHLSIGDEQLTVRLEATEAPEKGKDFHLATKSENIYLFDPVSNLTLY